LLIPCEEREEWAVCATVEAPLHILLRFRLEGVMEHEGLLFSLQELETFSRTCLAWFLVGMGDAEVVANCLVSAFHLRQPELEPPFSLPSIDVAEIVVEVAHWAWEDS
jgi:transposase InsO family protein